MVFPWNLRQDTMNMAPERDFVFPSFRLDPLNGQLWRGSQESKEMSAIRQRRAKHETCTVYFTLTCATNSLVGNTCANIEA